LVVNGVNVKESIDSVLLESFLAEVDMATSGLVGLEIELLLRQDLVDNATKVLNSYNFKLGSDVSVGNLYTTSEVVYTPVEIKLDKPGRLDDVLRNTMAVLSWLKKEDRVLVSRGNGIDYPSARPKIASTLRGGTRGTPLKQVSLPRGKTTSNYSGGTHLHFDVRSWFEDDGHIKRFFAACDNLRSMFKAYAVGPRYNSKDTDAFNPSGLEYAPFDKHHRLADLEKLYDIAPKGTELARYLSPQKFKYVTAHSANYRGDIEIRFFHGTLNINTIIDWFKLIMGVIESTRQEGPEHGDLGKALGRDNIDKLHQRRVKMDKSQNYSFNATRSPSRAFRKTFMMPRKRLAGLPSS